MIGWLVVLAAASVVAAIARWYVRAGGVSGYRGRDAERVELLRVQGAYSH